MKITVKMPKHGDIKSYINKPVINGVDLQGKAIGVIEHAVEMEDRYEVTIELWDRFAAFSTEFWDGKLSAISIKTK